MKIFILDDHSSVRESYKRWLELNKYNVVGDCGDIDECYSILSKSKCDIILMDIDFPEQNLGGISGCKKLKEKFPELKIIFVTHYTEPEIVLAGFQAGADGYFTKTDELKFLKRIIDDVSNNHKSLSPKALKSLLTILPLPININNLQRNESLKKILNENEIKILKFISQGFSNKEIATKLNTNEKKIKNEISNLLIKIGAKNRAQAVYIALTNNIID